jgi:hypothetical protein
VPAMSPAMIFLKGICPSIQDDQASTPRVHTSRVYIEPAEDVV